MPESWNGKLLLLAHGHRSENVPLSADFRTESPTYQHLLADGWMIASTSYRRNGAIVVDAVADIEQLRQHIVQTYGAPERVLVQGSSMGGAIVTLIAETDPEGYDGLLALGAALQVRDAEQPHEWSYTPRLPLLFVSNQSEVEGPQAYIQKAVQAQHSPGTPPQAYIEKMVNAPIVPVFWSVARDGHVNLRDIEQETALRALDAYLETGVIERDKDATIAPDHVSSAEFVEGGAYTKIESISSTYGNINTEFIEGDLQQLGISSKTRFQVSYGEQTFTVLLATTYGDVPRGEWVAFLTAEGRLRIARNYENASKTLGCKEGDKIFIAPAE